MSGTVFQPRVMTMKRIYVAEVWSALGSRWLTHSYHRSLAEMLMTQQSLEYSGRPCRVRAAYDVT